MWAMQNLQQIDPTGCATIAPVSSQTNKTKPLTAYQAQCNYDN